MNALLEAVKHSPPRPTGPRDWFTGLPAESQAEIRDLVALKRRDEAQVPHSFVQLAEIIIARYGLRCKTQAVRMALSRMYHEDKECPKSRERSRTKSPTRRRSTP